MDSATLLPINPGFVKITIGEDLVFLDANIVKDISKNQKEGYKIVTAIIFGVVPEDLTFKDLVLLVWQCG